MSHEVSLETMPHFRFRDRLLAEIALALGSELKSGGLLGRVYTEALANTLTARGDWYLSIGGEARWKSESFRNSSFGQKQQNNDSYFLQRYMLHFDLHMGSRVRAFFQIKSGLENGRKGGAGPFDKDKLDLNQAFVDIAPSLGAKGTMVLRLGRQEMLFGSARIVAPRDGPNVRLSFDGLRAIVRAGAWRIDTFITKPVETNSGLFDDVPDQDIASGDRDSTRVNLQTFNTLFLRGQYFGEIGLIGLANLIDLHPSLDLHLTDRLKVIGEWDVFWRKSVRDGIYGNATNLLQSGRTNRARHVGSQPSLGMEWEANPRVTFNANYTHFFAGDFLKEVVSRGTSIILCSR